MWLTNTDLNFQYDNISNKQQKNEIDPSKRENKTKTIDKYEKLKTGFEKKYSEFKTSVDKTPLDNITFKFTNRIKSHIEENSHDYYETLDISILESDIKYLNNLIIENPKTKYLNSEDNNKLSLCNLYFRFTDYGFLNIKSVFKIESLDVLQNYEDNILTIGITRYINENLRLIEDIIDYLIKEQYLIQKGYRFGIPDCLQATDDLKTDSYLYSSHIFSGVESNTNLSTIKDLLQLNIEDFDTESTSQKSSLKLQFNKEVSVVIKPSISFWTITEPINFKDIFYYTQSADIKLAEEVLYGTSSNIYIKLLEQFASHTKIEKKIKRITSSELRQLNILNRINVHKTQNRYHDLKDSQDSYLAIFENLVNSKNELRQSFYESEKMLGELVNESESEEKRRADNNIELILYFFTGLSFISVINDIYTFLLNKGKIREVPILESLEFYILDFAILLLAIIYIIIYQKKKK